MATKWVETHVPRPDLTTLLKGLHTYLNYLQRYDSNDLQGSDWAAVASPEGDYRVYHARTAKAALLELAVAVNMLRRLAKEPPPDLREQKNPKWRKNSDEFVALSEYAACVLGLERLLSEAEQTISRIEAYHDIWADKGDWILHTSWEAGQQEIEADTIEALIFSAWMLANQVRLLGEEDSLQEHIYYLSGEHPELGPVVEGWSGKETRVSIRKQPLPPARRIGQQPALEALLPSPLRA